MDNEYDSTFQALDGTILCEAVPAPPPPKPDIFPDAPVKTCMFDGRVMFLHPRTQIYYIRHTRDIKEKIERNRKIALDLRRGLGQSTVTPDGTLVRSSWSKEWSTYEYSKANGPKGYINFFSERDRDFDKAYQSWKEINAENQAECKRETEQKKQLKLLAWRNHEEAQKFFKTWLVENKIDCECPCRYKRCSCRCHDFDKMYPEHAQDLSPPSED